MEQKSKKYRDVKLFLILIPVINVINYYLTYKHISVSWHTLITFSLDTIEGYAAWLLVRYIILYLDKKIPFELNLVKRIFIQTSATLIAGISLIILLTELVNKIATNKLVPREFYTTDIFIIAIWFFVVNGIYIGMYFYYEWKQSRNREKNSEAARKLITKGFIVKTGKSDFLLSYNEIAGFFIEDEYAICSTLSDKRYLLDQSIDKIEKELPSIIFFRLNRQFLIHRQIITGFKRMENGKLNVLIKPCENISSPITVSRTKAVLFKAWFQPELNSVST